MVTPYKSILSRVVGVPLIFTLRPVRSFSAVTVVVTGATVTVHEAIKATRSTSAVPKNLFNIVGSFLG
jgi:hypothetical protein